MVYTTHIICMDVEICVVFFIFLIYQVLTLAHIYTHTNSHTYTPTVYGLVVREERGATRALIFWREATPNRTVCSESQEGTDWSYTCTLHSKRSVRWRGAGDGEQASGWSFLWLSLKFCCERTHTHTSTHVFDYYTLYANARKAVNKTLHYYTKKQQSNLNHRHLVDQMVFYNKTEPTRCVVCRSIWHTYRVSCVCCT